MQCKKKWLPITINKMKKIELVKQLSSKNMPIIDIIGRYISNLCGSWPSTNIKDIAVLTPKHIIFPWCFSMGRVVWLRWIMLNCQAFLVLINARLNTKKVQISFLTIVKICRISFSVSIIEIFNWNFKNPTFISF